MSISSKYRAFRITLWKRKQKALRKKFPTQLGWSCTRKIRYNMEEAGEKWDELNNGIMEFYICRYCGFIHLGRPTQKKT